MYLLSTRNTTALKCWLVVSCCSISAFANGQTAQAPERVVEGLQALYLFDAGIGDVVYDKSGVDHPLNLSISNSDNIRWDEDGLTLTAPVVVKSQGSAETLTQAITATNELTLEAWVSPLSLNQSGPARIVSLSDSISHRNMTLGQIEPLSESGSIFDIRLRTTFSGANGLRPPMPVLSNVDNEAMMHVLFSRDAAGVTSFYINGVKVEESFSLGDFSNWDESFTLLLGNELSEDRPWLGTLHLVALYNRALNADEVATNFTATPGSGQMDAIVSAERVRAVPETNSPESVSPETVSPELVSSEPIVTTQTAAAQGADSDPVVVSGSWPAGSNGDLPLGGVFYGNPIAGISTGNSAIGVESSRRFRAERTGEVSSVRFQNRVLTDDNIQSRCSPNDPDSKWCTCVNQNLDSYTCGYTLSNSYSVGNGGNLSVELRTDNGSGQPSSTVLGKTRSYVPKELSPNRHISLDFTSAVSLEAGGIYHLVHTNSNPPSNCSVAGMSPAEARSCPRDQGAVGLNGVFTNSTPSTTGKFGPFRGSRGTANLVRKSVGSGWSTYQFSSSYYELTYSDGVSVGDTYQAYDAAGAGRKDIGGRVLARQRFDVQDATREVDGLWLNFGHTRSSDGRPLNVRLKDDSGSTLATASIPASEHCRALAQGSSAADRNCRDWGYSDLSSTVRLTEGSRYYVEFSSASTGNFVLSALRNLIGGGYTDRNMWTQSVAQISTNGGSTWSQWAQGTAADDERDLALLFTISGMPRTLD